LKDGKPNADGEGINTRLHCTSSNKLVVVKLTAIRDEDCI
jgi:hypothetical protein